MKLVEETAVADTALPLATLRDYLRIGTGFADDGVQDGVLLGCLKAAMAAVEARTNKALLVRNFRWTLSAWRDLGRQVLPVAPVRSLTGLRIIDSSGTETEIPEERFRLADDTHRPALVSRGFMLPTIPVGGSAEIRFSAGFAPEWVDVPADLTQGVLLLAAHYYEIRHAAGAFEEMPADVGALVERHRPVRLFGVLG